MVQDDVVTRFPPSPTGHLHLGGARTALFNWLFARQRRGKFVLRIEDTDKARSSEEATKAILESLQWIGLDWDEGPFLQSERYHIYDAVIERLLSMNRAYHCHCSPEDLEQRRKEAMARGLKPKYDGKCRELGLGPAPGSVVRLKIPQTGITQFHDLVKGPIRFDNEELDDLVLRRSDGSPTYHLAVVADDISNGITHVIRGDDHVNNTPRQILIYKALEENLPQYAHVPMILGPDRTRLSKRHGATSVLAYREMGYLPHALLNGLARIGWSYGDQEKFTREELIEKFSLENVGKSAGIFNAEKMLDLNAWYIRESPEDYLARELVPFIEQMGFESPGLERLEQLAAILKKRSKTLVEMAEGARFYFTEPITYDKASDDKFLTPDLLELFEGIYRKLGQIPAFDQETLEKTFMSFLDETGVKFKRLAQPLRVALTGKTVSPGLFEVMEVLGKERVLERMDLALTHIRSKKQ